MAWLLVAVAISVGGSCDHTELRGRIVADPAEARVGVPVQLELEVPPELDRIHFVLWSVEPEARLEFEEVDRSVYPITYSKADRAAVFTADAPGTYVVRTEGVFRQTNFQPISEIELVVLPREGRPAEAEQDGPAPGPAEELPVSEAMADAVCSMEPTAQPTPGESLLGPCDEPSDPASGDFCDRFEAAVTGCWCDLRDPDPYLAGSPDVTIGDATQAVQFLRDSLQSLRERGVSPGADLRCVRVGGRFYNCFDETRYVGTLAVDGELRRTTCGV